MDGAETFLGYADEESHAIWTIRFVDKLTTLATIPSEIKWTLCTPDGVVVNNRENVSLTPASTANIVLSGADLALPDTASPRRYVYVSATVTTSYGSDLPIKTQGYFIIRNIKKIGAA